MTNYEYYREQIAKFARLGISFALNKNTKEIVKCAGFDCNNCVFFSYISPCAENKIEWAESECIEQEVDWSKIPVDTPILVSDDNKCWYRSYFAKYDNYAHRVCTWRGGRTSWSINYDGAYLVSNKEIWKYAKLAEVSGGRMMDIDYLKTALYERFHENGTDVTMVPLGKVIKFCDELLSTKDATKESEQE